MYCNYIGRNGNVLYRRILNEIINGGDLVSPRGKPTKEIQAVTNIISPMERVLTVPGRQNNPFFNIAENLAIVAAIEDQRSWLGHWNKNYLQFFDRDTDQQTWAFYGDRYRRWPKLGAGHTHGSIDQLKAITDKLTDDWFSRQGVAVAWHPVLDNMPGHRDYPCNFAVKFSIREWAVGPTAEKRKVLNMTVFNRSNDIHWGLFGVNLSQFSFIQEIMATILGVGVGHQVHVSDSLHLYLEPPHSEITERMLQYKDGFDIYEYVHPTPMFEIHGSIGWRDIDGALADWFRAFRELRRDPYDNVSVPGWYFLTDAWFALKAYDHKTDMQSLLANVFDGATWVACTEFLFRKRPENFDKDRLIHDVKERFGSNERLILSYIFSANIIEASV